MKKDPLDALFIHNQLRPLDDDVARKLAEDIFLFLKIDKKTGTPYALDSAAFEELSARERVELCLKAYRISARYYAVDPSARAIEKLCDLTPGRGKHYAEMFCHADERGNYWIVQ